MKAFAILLAMTSVCSAAEQREVRIVRKIWPDHLRPIEFPVTEERSYRAYLYKRLCPTAFDCGRFIEMPPFHKSEFSISVYSGKTGKYHVIFVDAADNLRDWSDAGRVLDRAKNVKVQRIDAEIPAATAILLKDVWIRMLSGHQTPRKERIDSDVMYGDTTIGEFSVRLANGRILRGETDLVPDLGKNTRTFVEIAEEWSEYCKAPPSKREAILHRVESKAKTLLARLRANR